MMGLASFQIRAYISSQQRAYNHKLTQTLTRVVKTSLQGLSDISQINLDLVLKNPDLPKDVDLLVCHYGDQPELVESNIHNPELRSYKNQLCPLLSMQAAPDNVPFPTSVLDLPGSDSYFVLRTRFQHNPPLPGFSYDLILLTSKKPFDQDVMNYVKTVIIRTIAHYIFVLFFLIITTRWSLRSLNRITGQIGEIRKGKRQLLSEDYELELQPLTSSLNKLLQNERQQRTRYQNAMNDLAHSLKTRLALIRITAHEQGLSPEATQQLDEQIMAMNQIVLYQLRRAVAGRQGLSDHKTDVIPLVSKLLTSLEKVYRDKRVQVTTHFGDDTSFIGDPNDLMELFGNLLDNAFKFAISQISITVRQETDHLLIIIEDDGPGIPVELRDKVLQRGVRADTSPGQGIGMAVVHEIIDSYAGSLTIEDSELGGALMRIHLSNN
ncbi:ATP-binding protein [Dongshaea marina]|uniref:ATP-binding protein n=1 Tax=Dongshaea marina TaxID=2047966 RepID=UPI00131F41B0|nr:ATP-binding protein [Dongshaea marina]